MSIRPKSTAALLLAVKVARQNPQAQFPVPGDSPMTATDVLRMWSRGVDARASRGLPELSARGQQRHADMLRLQQDLAIDLIKVDDYLLRRIRHTGCRNLLRTAAMQARYPHINNQPMEH